MYVHTINRKAYGNPMRRYAYSTKLTYIAQPHHQHRVWFSLICLLVVSISSLLPPIRLLHCQNINEIHHNLSAMNMLIMKLDKKYVPDAPYNGRLRYVRSIRFNDNPNTNVWYTDYLIPPSIAWLISQYESYDGTSSWWAIGRSYTW